METSASRQEYLRRIYKVQDYIEANLDQNLELTKLAEIAGFSKFHFHRIFKGISGESLLEFTKRLKLEKAASLLFIRQDLSITEIAYRTGFNDSGSFSRAFKQHYQLSPTDYRQQDRKICQALLKQTDYNEQVTSNQTLASERLLQGEVTIKGLPSFNVAYVRYIGAYQELQQQFSELMTELIAYGERYQLFNDKQTELLTIYHDNHEFTEEGNLRSSLCLSLPEDADLPETETIGKMVIPAGEYAVGYFELKQTDYPLAWDYLYSQWLSYSGYQPRDSFPFEVYLNDPALHPQQLHQVAIYFPIEALS